MRRPWRHPLAGVFLLSTAACHGAPIVAQDGTRLFNPRCPAGSSSLIDTSPDTPGWIAVDDINLYWTGGSIGSATLHSAPRCGGTAQTLATGLANPSQLAADKTNLYFGNDLRPGSIVSVPRGGGAATPLVTEGAVVYLVADDTSLYWSSAAPPSRIRKMAKTGGAPTDLAALPDAPAGIALDAANVYWISQNSESALFRVMKIAKSGGVAIQLTSASGGVAGANGGALTIDGDHLFLTTWLGWIGKLSTEGGLLTPLTAGQNADAIAVDGQRVYWINPPGQTGGQVGLFKMPEAGGTPEAISGLATGRGLVSDGTSIYFAVPHGIARLNT